MSTALAEISSSTMEQPSSFDDSGMELAHFHSAHSDKPREFYLASSLLILYSMLVANEGVSRFISSNPPALSTSPAALPGVVPLMGALAEIAFGLFGLLVGLSALMRHAYSLRAARLCVIVQYALGAYVLSVYVFLRPYFRARGLTAPLTPNLSLGESRLLIAFGALTSLSFCLALQGGQIAFVARMMRYARAPEYAQCPIATRKKAMLWSANTGLAGLWTLLTGLVLLMRERGFLVSTAYVSPPNVGRLPLITALTGGVMLMWGFLGTVFAAKGQKDLLRIFISASSVVYVVVFLNYSVLQLGLVPDASAAEAALYASLVFSAMFLGPFYMQKQIEDMKEDADVEAKA